MVKTKQSQLKAVANYQKFLYGWTKSESEETDEIRERRRGRYDTYFPTQRGKHARTSRKTVKTKLVWSCL